MKTVQEITKIILSNARDYGVETISLGQSVGRVLAEDLVADRDFPPFDRVSYDGIAIRFEDYERGQRTGIRQHDDARRRSLATCGPR